jgi:hypothetical protein
LLTSQQRGITKMAGYYACKTRCFFMVKGTVGLLVVNVEAAQLGAEIALEIAEGLRNRDGKPALPMKSGRAWYDKSDNPDFSYHYTAAAIARERLDTLNEVLEDVLGYED